MMTTPAINALRKTYPDAWIDFLSETGGVNILANNPHINRVWGISRHHTLRQFFSTVAQIRSQRYDVVIDFLSNPRTALLTWLSNVPKRIGFAHRGRKWAYTDPIKINSYPWEETRYSAAIKADLLQPLGITCTDFSLHLRDNAATTQEWQPTEIEIREKLAKRKWLVVCAPVSRRPYKRWPLERYAHIADKLIKQHQATVLLLHGPDQQEREAAQKVKQLMGEEALLSESVPNLMEVTDLFKKVDLYVGNDNGLRHLAIAKDVPTLTPFGKPTASNWTPPNHSLHLTSEIDVPCKNNCSYPKCTHFSCITAVSQQSIEMALDSLLPLIPKVSALTT